MFDANNTILQVQKNDIVNTATKRTLGLNDFIRRKRTEAMGNNKSGVEVQLAVENMEKTLKKNMTPVKEGVVPGVSPTKDVAKTKKAALRNLTTQKKHPGRVVSDSYVVPVAGRSQTVLKVGASCSWGMKSFMEDRHTIVPRLVESIEDSPSLFAVYDGHNGDFAAHHASTRLHQVLASEPLGNPSDMNSAIERAFLKIEEEILSREVKKERNSGTTAIVSIVRGEMLLVANVGDSRAVIATADQPMMRLSVDHKPDLPTERHRVEQSGGKVIFSGCWRVAHDRVPLRLAVSRALGDGQLKRNLPESCIAPLVSARPFVQQIKIRNQTEFVILASDGIWDVISDSEAVGLVREVFKDSNDENEDALLQITEELSKAAAEKLVNTALQKRSRDNITALVLGFKHH